MPLDTCLHCERPAPSRPDPLTTKPLTHAFESSPAKTARCSHESAAGLPGWGRCRPPTQPRAGAACVSHFCTLSAPTRLSLLVPLRPVSSLFQHSSLLLPLPALHWRRRTARSFLAPLFLALLLFLALAPPRQRGRRPLQRCSDQAAVPLMLSAHVESGEGRWRAMKGGREGGRRGRRGRPTGGEFRRCAEVDLRRLRLLAHLLLILGAPRRLLQRARRGLHA